MSSCGSSTASSEDLIHDLDTCRAHGSQFPAVHKIAIKDKAGSQLDSHLAKACRHSQAPRAR
jgi:hypothetical protein